MSVGTVAHWLRWPRVGERDRGRRGGSHALSVSQPGAVSETIRDAIAA